MRTFANALRGIWMMIASQRNARIHAVATIVVVAGGLLWRIDRQEWSWIVLAIMSVWVAESLNTALESLADATSPDFHPLVGKAKDVAAGGVLISAIGAVVIAILVFGPHLLRSLRIR